MANRKKDSGQQIIRNLFVSSVKAERHGWTARRCRTVVLDAKELLRRLDPDNNLTDEQIELDILGF